VILLLQEGEMEISYDMKVAQGVNCKVGKTNMIGGQKERHEK
jgi:hypothetical protein